MEAISSSNVGQPLLTIAIPTYNRAAFLALCLQRISEELDSLNADQRRLVKVYVSNNASTDHTDQVVSQYRQMKAEAFEVVCNRENIGADRNITQCYASATTPYVWVLGDDDVILTGKLKIVLDVLAKHEIDILYLNGYAYSDSYLDEPRRGRGKSGVAEYSSALDFVKHTHVMLTFITALIVRSGVNLASVSQVVEGSKLLHLSWVLQLVRDGKNFAIIEDRIFAAKLDNVSYEVGNLGNSGGYGAINIFGNSLTHIANGILKNQPELVKVIQNGAIVTWFPTYIMNLRKGEVGYLKEDVAIAMRRVFKDNWRYHLFLVPLISLPLTLARIYFVFVRLTRKLLGGILL
jgi:abequosyltransferase